MVACSFIDLGLQQKEISQLYRQESPNHSISSDRTYLLNLELTGRFKCCRRFVTHSKDSKSGVVWPQKCMCGVATLKVATVP